MSESTDNPRDNLTPGNPKPTGKLCKQCWDEGKLLNRVFYSYLGGTTGCYAGHQSPEEFSPETGDQVLVIDEGFKMYYAEERRLKAGG